VISEVMLHFTWAARPFLPFGAAARTQQARSLERRLSKHVDFVRSGRPCESNHRRGQ
jgi:hypothetical protein